MTKEDFNKNIQVGDIVTIFGTGKEINCVVMTKTQYACNLLSVERSKEYPYLPDASFYRSYNEIIKKVGEDYDLYIEYEKLSEADNKKQRTIMHYTTVEQSKKLLQIGLSSDTADMFYFLDPTPAGNIYIPSISFDDRHLISRKPEYDKGDIPCWTLEALLEAIPQSIQIYDSMSHCRKNYSLNLFRSYYHCCSYSYGPSLKKENHDNLCCFGADTWLEAVYDVVVWLAEKGWLTCERQKGNFIIVD